MDTTRTGQGMMAIACIIGLALLTVFFNGVEERKRNPNADPDSMVYQNQVEVPLKQNGKPANKPVLYEVIKKFK